MSFVDSIISGEKIQQLCDVYCGSEYDLHRNPIISNQCERHVRIDALETEWNNPSLIFCYSCALTIFMNKLHLFKNPFVLVSHNEDDNITEHYRSLADSPLLLKWFAQNVMIQHPKITILPIGIANSMWPHGNIYHFNQVKQLQTHKENKIYFYFNTSTNSSMREPCRQILEWKGLQFGSNQHHIDYLRELSTSKFAICPPGNGVDCHRTWECYYFDVIPILLQSAFTDHLHKMLPCIVLSNWNEFDYNQIMLQYDILYQQLCDNRKYIDFEYYKECISSSISISTPPLTDKINTDYTVLKSYSLTDCKHEEIDFKLDRIIQKTHGFFIELGANDGLRQSNTAFFEFYRGWKGVLIEPSKNTYQECIKNRPNSICYNYACVSNDYQGDEIIGDFQGHLMSSVNGERRHTDSLVSVKATTLETIMDNVRPEVIDLLSLDTEGYELPILQGLNLNRYRPRYMLIEIYTKDYDIIISYLQQHNYSLLCNMTNYNPTDNPHWDGTHNDYLFKDMTV